jgi:hypothetical protein
MHVYLWYLNAEDQYANAEKAQADFVTSRHLRAKHWKLQQEAKCQFVLVSGSSDDRSLPYVDICIDTPACLH